MSTELKQSENESLIQTNPKQDNPQSEPSSEQTPKPESSQETETTLVSIKEETIDEADKAKTFAFDINQKIDELQSHIDDLSGGFKRSKGALSQALGDLQSRTSSLTGEIDSIGILIAKNDANKSKLMNDMNDRFNRSFNLLTEELGGIESQIQSQYARLNKLQRDLNQSYKLLSERISSEQDKTQGFIDGLEKENEKQNKTQKAFSDYLGELQEKTNTTADEVYKLNTDVLIHKRLTRKHFKITAASAIGVCATLAGLMIYLHSSPPNNELLITQQLEQHSSEMSELYSSKSLTTEEINQLGQQLSITNQELSAIETNLLQLQTALSNQQLSASKTEANTNASLSELLSKVSALELSLYGPSDATTLPSPKVTIESNDWITQQEASNYVIQLVGVYRERSVITFANQHASDLATAPLSTNISEYRGQNWYNLYYGNFNSFSEAQAALDKLPSAIQDNSPWIRSISSVLKTAKAS